MPVKFYVTNLEDAVAMKRVGALLREWTFDRSLWENLTPAETKAALEMKNGAGTITGAKFDGDVDGVDIRQSEMPGTFQVTLPPADSLQSGLDQINLDHENYTIQPHYTTFVLDRENSGTMFDEKNEVLDFYDVRIADYTLQHCM